MRRIVAGMAAVMLTSGCGIGSSPSSPATTASASGPSTTTAPTSEATPTSSGSATPEATDAERPIDPTVEPVSASDPPPGAATAMDACGVETHGMEAIAGMGLLPADRAKEDAFLTGLEPELMGDGLVWVIQFAGAIPQLRSGEVWVDPICVSGAGPAGFYATGDVVLPDGSLATRAPVPDPPVYRLPPLAP